MKIILSGILLGLLFFNSSCKKDKNTEPVVEIQKPDTLTTGWKKIIVNKSDNYADIFFKNNNTGYLTGTKTYKSLDGGINWTKISDHPFGNLSVTDNGNSFFTAGVPDTIFKSSDGGNTFTFLKINFSYISNIFFVDDNNGYINSLNGLYNTKDGGINWIKLKATGISNLEGLSSLFFTNTNTGWVVSYKSIFRTVDAGLNWLQGSFAGTVNPVGTFTSVYVTPNSNVYISNNAGQIYKSIDGGATFVQLKDFGYSSYFCDVHFVDDNTGYVCNDNKIYKTTDAGITWKTVVSLGNAKLVEIHFTDAKHGWACGENGTVLIYNN
jgi:photosystem II stability/assembly factor-like uncharacterized protein